VPGGWLNTSPMRVLVVDDSEPFRRILRSILQDNLAPRAIVEAVDGIEAVELAQVLQPDLVLLDIGLPKLNGIAAARRIRVLSPQSKILFVSQESSVDIVQAAFSLGASGYVVKAKVGSELMTAVKAVLQGEKFVGSRFAGHGFSGLSDGLTRSPESNIGFAPAERKAIGVPSRHEAGFYSDERSFLENVTQFIGTALQAGKTAIVAATESHRDSLLPRLQAHGADISVAIEQGRYISLDAADALSKVMLDGVLDSARFLECAGNFISTAAKAATGKRAGVALFGESAQLLWAKGNAEAAIQIERLTNQLIKSYDVDILCGYSVDSVYSGMNDTIFQRICAEHSAVHSR
jgi:DNA-binding NarL/FixJ family response regulator